MTIDELLIFAILVAIAFVVIMIREYRRMKSFKEYMKEREKNEKRNQ